MGRPGPSNQGKANDNTDRMDKINGSFLVFLLLIVIGLDLYKDKKTDVIIIKILYNIFVS